MDIDVKPIGFVKTDEKEIPHCWKMSEVEGSLVIDGNYQEGIKDLEVGQHIFVLFHYHKSPRFSEKDLIVDHPEYDGKFGVFSTHSAVRPNPIGMAFLEVTDVKSDTIRVRGLDIIDKTPILDIKPDSCPWD